MSLVLCAPFYKGLVDAEDPESMALITRRDPTTDNEIPLARYVQLVREANPRHSELVQDIARASASALQAAALGQRGRSVMLASVEGCEQIVGGKPITGGKIMESIWCSLPADLMAGIPIRIEQRSRCTIQEVRALLEAFGTSGKSSAICGVTHGYHVPRVSRMLREESQKETVVQVETPETIVDIFHNQPYADFVRDVVKAGAPSTIVALKEGMMECAYTPLHGISRLGEFLTGRNLEMFLANRTRKK